MVAAEPSATGPTRNRHRLAVAAALVVVVALVAGMVLALPRRDHHEAEGWDPRVVELVRFVERTRGLTFDHPVPVRFLDPADFRATVAEPDHDDPDVDGAGTRSPDDPQLGAAIHRALGVAEGALPDEANRAELDEAHVEDVTGLYRSDREDIDRRAQAAPARCP